MHSTIRFLMLIAALSLAEAAALGAWGAHGATKVLSPEKLHSWEIAVQYQFFHSIGILLIGLLHNQFPMKLLRNTAILMLIGICLFSGAIYINCLGGPKWLGMVAPLGGASFIVSWIMLAVAVWKIGAANKG